MKATFVSNNIHVERSINKFSRNEIIEILKMNNARVDVNKMDGEYLKINISVLADFRLTIDDLMK